MSSGGKVGHTPDERRPLRFELPASRAGEVIREIFPVASAGVDFTGPHD